MANKPHLKDLRKTTLHVAVVGAVFGFSGTSTPALAADFSMQGTIIVAAACNPCNPCAAGNPCNPCNPCAAGDVDPEDVVRPEGTEPYSGDREELVSMGEDLWADTGLSTNGLSCQTCHQGNQNFKATFSEPYPHKVAMATERAGLGEITAEQMVQLCMVVPMQGEPLPWDSKELAALAAYTTEVQKGYNPCAAANPCNPCAADNPCNPCAACNPCNPCAAD